jgi:hypothetical protein
MANLSPLEKYKFEKLFGMETGYVLDFSNRTFQEFILDSVGIDIYDAKYNYWSGSKANRLRAFWKVEQDAVVGKLLLDLLEYWGLMSDQTPSSHERSLYDECWRIASRLKDTPLVEGYEVLESYADVEDFASLMNAIRESIERNEPETALDRLHTFVVRYIRRLCDKHEISYDKKTPLHGLLGSYVKHLRSNGLLESQMAERILKSSVRIIQDFNHVRNDKSLAHDNPLLNKNESILIFNFVASTIRFIETVEKGMAEKSGIDNGISSDIDFDDIPF